MHWGKRVTPAFSAIFAARDVHARGPDNAVLSGCVLPKIYVSGFRGNRKSAVAGRTTGCDRRLNSCGDRIMPCSCALHCITLYDMESQLTIRLPADLSGALERASRQSGRKTSDIVRSALREYLNAPTESGPRPAERVRGLIGSLDSGLPDLAEQHRKYIIESLTRGK